MFKVIFQKKRKLSHYKLFVKALRKQDQFNLHACMFSMKIIWGTLHKLTKNCFHFLVLRNALRNIGIYGPRLTDSVFSENTYNFP